MNNVLITGITGKTGKYMLQEMILHAEELKDYKFRLAVRSQASSNFIDEQIAGVALNIEKHSANIENAEELDALTDFGREPWTMVHIAGIGKSEALVKAAVKNNVKRLILVHTTGIYSKYKAAGEIYRQIETHISEMIEDKDIELTILRPTMIYGDLNDKNISIFIKMVDKLKIFPTVSGAKFDLQPVWCGDLGKAYYDVLMHPEETKNKNYVLSGGEPIMLIEMFRVIERYLGKKNTYISVPFWIAYSGAVVLYGITLGKKDYREKVQRLVEPRAYPHDEARKDFGYNPLKFEDGVKQEVEEYIRATRANEEK